MADTYGLRDYYLNLVRLGSVDRISAADEAQIKILETAIHTAESGLFQGQLPMDRATAIMKVVNLADSTAGVAVMSYGFFTGQALTKAGFDFLLSPTGGNPNNLNSAYYAQFNTENRFINFAVNLGSGGGAGAAKFAADYGSLSLADTLVKASLDISGKVLTTAEADALLKVQVPNGLGGMYTRADYLADITHDSLTGIKTKAAIVGWLLSESAKADVGQYSDASNAFLADVALDYDAQFGANLLATYGANGEYGPNGDHYAGLPGRDLSFGTEIIVGTEIYYGTTNPGAPPSQVPANYYYSTAGNDTFVTTAGLKADDGLFSGWKTGAGNDTLRLSGVVSGSLDSGSGNDKIFVATADGAITTGSGYDTVEIGNLAPLHLNNGVVTVTAKITDFEQGKDVVRFGAVFGEAVRLTQKDVVEAANFQAALSAASAATAAGKTAVFDYDGHTYVYHQDAVAGVSADDGLIQLVGVTGLTLATGTSAGDLHFA